MRLFQLPEILREVEDSDTSIGADVSFMEEETPEVEKYIESDDEPDVDVPDDDEADADSDTPEEESEELEEESETKAPDDLSLLQPFDRPSFKQITEVFPDFFKKFPAMRDVYFRESEYSKIFPTIGDAQEADENNQAFTALRDNIFEGDGDQLFAAIRETNEKQLERLSGSLLTTLYKVHPNAFWRAANPLVEDICRNMFLKGEKDSNANLQNAARYLSDFFFGKTSIAEGKESTTVKDDETNEVKQEREAFKNEKMSGFRQGVSDDIRVQLIKVIIGKDSKSGKSRIDPDDALSSFIKTTIIQRISDDIGSQLQADQNHLRGMDSLWTRAIKNGFTEEDKARLITAYLARAKSMVPSLRSKYVSEALGRRSSAVSRDKKKISAVSSRKEVGGSGKVSSDTKNYNPKAIDFRKTSDLDILNDNITYRK